MPNVVFKNATKQKQKSLTAQPEPETCLEKGMHSSMCIGVTYFSKLLLTISSSKEKQTKRRTKMGIFPLSVSAKKKLL
jgi:hypothetical protein